MPSEESGINRNLWDTASMIPVEVLSFILDQVLPGFYIDGEYARKIRSHQRVIDFSQFPNYTGLDKELTKISHDMAGFSSFLRNTTDVLLMGSIMDSLPILSSVSMSDADMWVVLKQFTVGFSNNSNTQLFANSTECSPAYTRLQFNEPIQEKLSFEAIMYIHKYKEIAGVQEYSDGPIYLSSEMMKDNLFQGMLTTFPDMMEGIHGPAVSGGKEGMDYDMVMVIPCHEWPPIARAWITRQRPSSWPPQEMIEEISQSGCELVAAGHPTSLMKHLEWRISFTRAEQKLCRSFNTTQKQCYLLLKAILKTQLSTMKTFTTYMLKTMMFWTLEKLSKEKLVHKNGLGIHFLTVLDGLINGFIKHFIPEYFMPARNLIAHIHPCFIRSTVKKMIDIRRHPVQYILNVGSQEMFSVANKITVPYSDLLSPILSITFSTYDGRKHINEAKLEISWRLFYGYLSSDYMPGACAAFLYLLQRNDCYVNSKDKFVMNSICKMTSLRDIKLAKFMSYLYDIAPNDFVIREAEKYFNQALVNTSAEFKPEIMSEYMSFLCKLPQGNKRTLEVASGIVDSFHLGITFHDEYAALFSTDICLRAFYDELDRTMVVSARALALYYCVKLNTIDKFYSEANIFVDDLMKLALTLDMNGYDELDGHPCITLKLDEKARSVFLTQEIEDTYVILGFTLLWVKDYYSAFKVFKRISQMHEPAPITQDFQAISLILGVLQKQERISCGLKSMISPFEVSRRCNLDNLPKVVPHDQSDELGIHWEAFKTQNYPANSEDLLRMFIGDHGLLYSDQEVQNTGSPEINPGDMSLVENVANKLESVLDGFNLERHVSEDYHFSDESLD